MGGICDAEEPPPQLGVLHLSFALDFLGDLRGPEYLKSWPQILVCSW